jgi:MtN3 and saliva related transmembrane protein
VLLTLVGTVAGVLTTGAWLPQLLKCWRTRSAADLSWSYLAVLGTGVALWAVYGLLSSDLVLILANVITVLALLLLVGFKVAFARTPVGSLAERMGSVDRPPA